MTTFPSARKILMTTMILISRPKRFHQHSPSLLLLVETSLSIKRPRASLHVVVPKPLPLPENVDGRMLPAPRLIISHSATLHRIPVKVILGLSPTNIVKPTPPSEFSGSDVFPSHIPAILPLIQFQALGILLRGGIGVIVFAADDLHKAQVPRVVPLRLVPRCWSQPLTLG